MFACVAKRCANSYLAELARVRARASHSLDLVKEIGEGVGVVVGHLVLKDAHEALEAHASVHVPRRQSAQLCAHTQKESKKHNSQ